VFDDDTKQWDFDIDGEEIAFSNGTIYNDKTNGWEYGYVGNGKYVGMEDKLSTQLTQQLDKWNLRLKTKVKK
jgi:hypothetical protein